LLKIKSALIWAGNLAADFIQQQDGGIPSDRTLRRGFYSLPRGFVKEKKRQEKNAGKLKDLFEQVFLEGNHLPINIDQGTDDRGSASGRFPWSHSPS